MDNKLLKKIQEKVQQWREAEYKGAQRETLNILDHIRRAGYLYQPQIEALETYIYLKEIVGNKPMTSAVAEIFDDEKELISSLGISDKDEIIDLLLSKDKEEKIKKLLKNQYNGIDYSNQVYALTMGSGKTLLMGTMILYDFVLSFYHKEDNRFGKNALVFAPDTTIIESLKEIKTFDYTKVLPKEYQNIVLNIKYHYLESTDTPLQPLGNYNIVVSNSQKIILKTRHQEDKQSQLFRDESLLHKRAVENKRLQAIRELASLIVFVDEAHHAYGTTLEGTLKKTKQTINYIHEEGKTPLVGVINLTGTPYVKNKMIADVVYHFGLKEGIEKGILKQVRVYDYANVKSNEFIEDVITKFWSEYGENRLEERLPKIAFYAANIEEVRRELRPRLEAVLLKNGISTEKILEYHTEAEENKDDFLVVDTPQSKKQFILLVGKGTEGWNCRSLVSCALFRKPRSSIFVLQSSTRCLRSIGDNSTVASIFLSNDNYRILDRELQSNFAMDIKELEGQDQKSVEHTLTVEKKKKLKVKKKLTEIISAQKLGAEKIKVDWSKYQPEKYLPYITETGILLSEDLRAEYKRMIDKQKIEPKNNFTFYEIVEVINRNTLLPCLVIEQILLESGLEKDKLVEMINGSSGAVQFVIEWVLANAYEYKEKTEILEEEIELTKFDTFKINVANNRRALVVYKKDEPSGRLGFHIDPYSFDSADEKNLFRILRDKLEKEEVVVDIYFTGGITDAVHNDFYFEYYSPLNQKMSRYFPDFLVETSKGRFLVIEVKSNAERLDYEQNKKTYKGKREEIFNEVFAKEVGFRQFKDINQEFEYHIIFDASLQKQQQELLDYLQAVKK